VTQRLLLVRGEQVVAGAVIQADMHMQTR
jgi:hypothetical protein